LERVCIQSAIVNHLLMAHAWPRLGGFPALPITDSTRSAALLAFKARSGASPHQSWALSADSLNSALIGLTPGIYPHNGPPCRGGGRYL
jgi:hypothetical protein